MSTIPSAACVGLDVDGVTVAVHLAPGKGIEDLTDADKDALEELVAACLVRLKARRLVEPRRGDCFVCKGQPRVIRGNLAPHRDKVGRFCPGSGSDAP